MTNTDEYKEKVIKIQALFDDMDITALRYLQDMIHIAILKKMVDNKA